MNLECKIRKILLSTWDPFGIGDNKNLSDEYDIFIDRIIPLLNSDRKDLLSLFDEIEFFIKAPTSLSHKEKVVDELKSLTSE